MPGWWWVAVTVRPPVRARGPGPPDRPAWGCRGWPPPARSRRPAAGSPRLGCRGWEDWSRPRWAGRAGGRRWWSCDLLGVEGAGPRRGEVRRGARPGGRPVPAPGPVTGLIEEVLVQARGGGPVMGFGVAQRAGGGAPLGGGAPGRRL